VRVDLVSTAQLEWYLKFRIVTMPMDEQQLNDEQTGLPASEAENASSANGQEVAPDAEPVLGKENDLNVRLEEAEARAGEYLQSLQRERASFQNYRKRVEQERSEQGRIIAGTVLTRLLPILDDFYRAVDAVPESERDQWFEGIILILRKFERLLDNEGVTEIEALGQPFDPNFHEAVGVDGGSDAESDTVTAVMQRGYKIGDRVLRPAMVRVAE